MSNNVKKGTQTDNRLENHSKPQESYQTRKSRIRFPKRPPPQDRPCHHEKGKRQKKVG